MKSLIFFNDFDMIVISINASDLRLPLFYLLLS